jgi:hypothetical protein
MTRSTKRLAVLVAVILLTPAVVLAGVFSWQMYQHAAGPRTIAPKVLVPEWDGPGALPKEQGPPAPDQKPD